MEKGRMGEMHYSRAFREKGVEKGEPTASPHFCPQSTP